MEASTENITDGIHASSLVGKSLGINELLKEMGEWTNEFN